MSDTINLLLQINDESADETRGLIAGEEAVDADSRLIMGQLRDTVDPIASDDGYPVGTRWINTATDLIFTCVDNTPASAIWEQEITSVVGGGVGAVGGITLDKLGSENDLGIAWPLIDGVLDAASHTDAARLGWYASRTDDGFSGLGAAAYVGVVVEGALRLQIADNKIATQGDFTVGDDLVVLDEIRAAPGGGAANPKVTFHDGTSGYDPSAITAGWWLDTTGGSEFIGTTILGTHAMSVYADHVYVDGYGSFGTNSGLSDEDFGGDIASSLEVIADGVTKDSPMIDEGKNQIFLWGDDRAYFHGRAVNAAGIGASEFILGTSKFDGHILIGSMTSHDVEIRTNNTQRILVDATTGDVSLLSTTTATSTTTGALTVAGGVGITENLYAGGDAQVSGTVTIDDLTGTAVNFVGANASGQLVDTGIPAAATATVPGGADTHVQFNDGGAFGGSANFTWDGDSLAITGSPASGTAAVQITAAVSSGELLNGFNFNGNEIYRLNSDGFEQPYFELLRDDGSSLFIATTGAMSYTPAVDAVFDLITDGTDGESILYLGENGGREAWLRYDGSANTLQLGGNNEDNIVIDRDSGDVTIESTTTSTSAINGALHVIGGVGIGDDTFIDGILGLEDANGNVVISQSATLGSSDSVGIGKDVDISGGECVAIGQNARAQSNSGVAIGHNATSTTDSVVLGAQATGNGNDCVVIGRSASCGGNQSIVIGRSAESTGGQQFIVGDDNNGRDIRDVYIGGGVTTEDPNNVTYHGTGGEGTDNAGANLSIAPGRSTGNVIGGYFQLLFAPAGSSGSSLNNLVSTLRFRGSVAPPSFAAAGDVDGIDAYIRSQDGGAHSAANPRGGDVIIELGAGGAGGAGRDGRFQVNGDTIVDGFLRLSSKAGTTGDGDIWLDSTQKGLQTYVNGIEQGVPGCLLTQTADQTIANTTTETLLLGTGVGTNTLPADFFVVGKTVRIIVHGTIANTGTPTIRLRLRLGASLIVDSGVVTLSSLGGTRPFRAEYLLTCRSTGATGTIEGAIWFSYTNAAGATDARVINVAPASGTVDTTSSQDVNPSVKWGTASPSNTITSRLGSIEVLN